MKRVPFRFPVIVIMLFFISLTAIGQETITGTIIDKQKKEPLYGATVQIKGTTQGIATDHNGIFTLKTNGHKNITLLFKCLGYTEKEIQANATDKKTVNLGHIELSPSSIGLDEIKVLASFAPEKGKTSIVYSSVSAEDIETKLSNQEFPEILKSTPSLYVTKQGGGAGDARINLRGFNSDNIALLINGIPVNGMENGAVYWSNWAGLADVTQSIQVQRGIGVSSLGVPSVGGTINIVTKTIDAESGGSAYYGIGNDGYQKMSLNLSTGMMKNGWALTLSGSRTSGNGYVNGTNFESWNYFFNLSKRINSDHLLSFTAFGAPQWHNQRGNKQLIEDYRNHKDGIRMNTSYGYLNGKVLATGGGYNEYHKPQLALNHYWTINDKSTLSTSAYASISSGGGRKVYPGYPKNMLLQYDNKTGKPGATTKLTPDGLIDYESVMEMNKNSANGVEAFFSMGTNAHDWYGLLSTYKNKFSNLFHFTAGIDGRYYKGYHYEKIDDLLGGSYFKENKLAYRDPETKLKVGDKIAYDNASYIFWSGAFSQLEFTKDNYSAFISGSISNQMYKRNDPGTYGQYSNQETRPASMVETGWQHFIPTTIKAGFNYKFAEIHNVYINGGYVTKAPMFDGVFPAKDNNVLEDVKMEKILTGEIGYGINTRELSVNINGYYTHWMDRTVTKPLGGQYAAIPNINAEHMGIEIEAAYRPFTTLSFSGAFSLGSWKWQNDANFILYDEHNQKLGDYHAYIKGLHVGNAPQTSISLGANWEPFNNFRIGANWNYYGRNYADFDPTNRSVENDYSDSWRMPNFSTVDLNMNYRFPIGKTSAILYSNVNNLFNNEYISDALDGKDHSEATAMVWYGFGITWTTGVKIAF